MLIINHQINSIGQLQNTPKKFGVEVDLRAYNNRIILNHEPFLEGEDFEEFLKHYHHAYLILNIKCEGIERLVIGLMDKFRIRDYFLLDVTPPFIFKLVNQGISKIAVRFSEMESIETCLNLKGKLEWVFVDNLTHLPVEHDAFKTLRKYFKLCIVSPELLNRNEIESVKEILKDNPVDAVLTDKIYDWEELAEQKKEKNKC
ncbi:MAG TPA: hypothetical protein VJA23_02435 [Candidatus Nanoarchaeia archaeon]|nr:hypothetical protein [Candidatus Nanoarchaeia archaeon]